MIRRPPRSPLFPYPPLSRSKDAINSADVGAIDAGVRHDESEPMTHDQDIGPGAHYLGRFGKHQLDQPRILVRNRGQFRSEEHTSELQSQSNLVCRLLLEKKK